MKKAKASWVWLVVGFFISVPVLANDPPEVDPSTREYEVRENGIAVFALRVFDPEQGDLKVRFLNPPGFKLDFQQSEATVESGTQIRNEFPVPSGTEGKTLSVTVEVEDSEEAVTKAEYSFHVVSINHAPEVILHVMQGDNREGSTTNPFKAGGVGVELEIVDPDRSGSYGLRWGASRVSGGFCSGNLMFFGGEGRTPVVVVPKVSYLSGVSVSCLVTDGTHTVEVTRVFYVRPEPGGCVIEDPLDKISAKAVPEKVSFGETISLLGDHPNRSSLDVDTAWYLISSSARLSEVLIDEGWEASYRAPNYETTLQFKFIASNERKKVSRTVSVPVSRKASGGGGSTGGGSQGGSCPYCATGSPPVVDAGSAVNEVVGGQAFSLNPQAGDPNLPAGSIPSLSAQWRIVEAPAGLKVAVENPYQLKTRLLTPEVTSPVTVKLELTVTAASSGCSCSDTILVTIVPKAKVDPMAQISYAFEGQSYKNASSGATIRRNIDAFPVEIRLQASIAGFENPVIEWESDSQSTLTSKTGRTTTLQVPGSDGSDASIPVSLTVSEADESSISITSRVTFLLTAPNRQASIKYSFDGEHFEVVGDGETIEHQVTSLPFTIALEGVAEGFGIPSYSWETEAPGVLGADQGLTTTLQIAEIDGSKVEVPLSLSVKEWMSPGVEKVARIKFRLEAPEPNAAIRYSFDGQNFETAADGATIMHDAASLPVQIHLEAQVEGVGKASFKWETEDPAKIQPSSGQRTVLVIERSASVSITVPVVLKVEEETRSTGSLDVSLKFQLTLPEVSEPPVGVDFTISTGTAAEPGTMVILEGTAESASGGPLYELKFDWSVQTDEGQPVEVLSNHSRAVFRVPSASSLDSQLAIKLVVSEGESASEPVVKSLDIILPTLHFAHFGVGSLGNGEELLVELVMVNDSVDDVEDAEMFFIGQDGEPVELDVDGSLSNSRGFALGAGEARQFLLRSPNGDVRQGWIKVCSTVRLTGVALFRYSNELTGDVKTETALFSSKAGRRFTTAVRAGTNPDLGLAIANPTSGPVEFRISVREAGSEQDVTVEWELGPMQQMASFLPNLFRAFPIPGEFKGGTLTIEVPEGKEGALIATMLRLRNGFLTSVPLAVRSE